MISLKHFRSVYPPLSFFPAGFFCLLSFSHFLGELWLSGTFSLPLHTGIIYYICSRKETELVLIHLSTTAPKFGLYVPHITSGNDTWNLNRFLPHSTTGVSWRAPAEKKIPKLSHFFYLGFWLVFLNVPVCQSSFWSCAFGNCWCVLLVYEATGESVWFLFFSEYFIKWMES